MCYQDMLPGEEEDDDPSPGPSCGPSTRKSPSKGTLKKKGSSSKMSEDNAMSMAVQKMVQMDQDLHRERKVCELYLDIYSIICEK